MGRQGGIYYEVKQLERQMALYGGQLPFVTLPRVEELFLRGICMPSMCFYACVFQTQGRDPTWGSHEMSSN